MEPGLQQAIIQEEPESHLKNYDIVAVATSPAVEQVIHTLLYDASTYTIYIYA